MKSMLILALIVIASALPASFADQGTKQVQAEGKSFDVTYSVDGNILAIGVDKESTSILIGLDQTKASTFKVSFPPELLAAQNGEFVVLVDGEESDYTTSYDNGKPTLTIPIPEDTQEIEIIGTSVVPEFPTGAVLVMIVMSAVAVLFTKSRLEIFK